MSSVNARIVEIRYQQYINLKETNSDFFINFFIA